MKSKVLSLSILALAACSPPVNNNNGDAGSQPDRVAPVDASTNDVAPPPEEMIPDPGENTGEPLPEEDTGPVSEPAPMASSCTGFRTATTGIGPDGARFCIDFPTEFAGDAAMMLCQDGGGTYQTGQSCDTTNSYYVSSCTKELGSTVTARFYRPSATRTNPDPPNITATDVATWCSANGWMPPPAPPTPTNTGRCRFSSASTFMEYDTTELAVCVNYDRGYSVDDATSDCTQANLMTRAAPTLNLGESCTAGASTPGCSYTLPDGKVQTVRISWPYRSSPPASWTNERFRQGCEATGGTFFVGR